MRQLVRAGYDCIAPRFDAWAQRIRRDERRRYADYVVRGIAPGGAILELGCGTGLESSRAFAAHGRWVGVDLSWSQLAVAKRAMPGACLIHADMTELGIRPASLDAVVAFYSIIHVPRHRHAALLTDIATWLRPDGLFVAAFGTRDTAVDIAQEWLGVPMFWSSHTVDVTRALIRRAGLDVRCEAVETAEEDGRPISFYWVCARRLASRAETSGPRAAPAGLRRPSG